MKAREVVAILRQNGFIEDIRSAATKRFFTETAGGSRFRFTLVIFARGRFERFSERPRSIRILTDQNDLPYHVWSCPFLR
jgi:hypothetical protein